jgi:hypothetical protein
MKNTTSSSAPIESVPYSELPKVSKIVHFNVTLSRIGLMIPVTLVFVAYFFGSWMAIDYSIIDILDGLPGLTFGLTILVTFGIIGWYYADTILGALFNVFGTVGAYILMKPVLWSYSFINVLPILEILKWGLLGFNIITLLLTVINLILLLVPAHRGLHRMNFHQKKRSILITLGILAVIGVSTAIAQNPQVYPQQILVSPKDYNARIAFWAGDTYSLYTPTEKAELNEYHAILITCNCYDIRFPGPRQTFIDNMNLWKTNYPNVTIEMSMPGIMRINNTGDDKVDFLWGGVAYDGAAEGITKFAKEYIQLAQAENLTNFGGINTDQEAPSSDLQTIYGINIEPDAARHANATAIYRDFFAWVAANAPEMRLSTTVGTQQVMDNLDGDDDVQIIEKDNVYAGGEGYNEIAPMIYRARISGAAPYGDVPVTNPADLRPMDWVYHKMQEFATALQKNDGNLDRIGVYLGITNQSDYGRDIRQYNKEGQLIGYGFDNLVRDGLIAKAFGCKIITIFLMNTNYDQSGHSMGGVFDSYGEDFLDRYMAAINGPNSRNPFYLESNPNLSMSGDIINDLMYNLGHPEGFTLFLVFLGCDIVAGVWLHPKYRQKWTWKVKALLAHRT